MFRLGIFGIFEIFNLNVVCMHNNYNAKARWSNRQARAAQIALKCVPTTVLTYCVNKVVKKANVNKTLSKNSRHTLAKNVVYSMCRTIDHDKLKPILRLNLLLTSNLQGVNNINEIKIQVKKLFDNVGKWFPKSRGNSNSPHVNHIFSSIVLMAFLMDIPSTNKHRSSDGNKQTTTAALMEKCIDHLEFYYSTMSFSGAHNGGSFIETVVAHILSNIITNKVTTISHTNWPTKMKILYNTDMWQDMVVGYLVSLRNPSHNNTRIITLGRLKDIVSQHSVSSTNGGLLLPARNKAQPSARHPNASKHAPTLPTRQTRRVARHLALTTQIEVDPCSVPI
jgi:hypothetical protein